MVPGRAAGAHPRPADAPPEGGAGAPGHADGDQPLRRLGGRAAARPGRRAAGHAAVDHGRRRATAGDRRSAAADSPQRPPLVPQRRQRGLGQGALAGPRRAGARRRRLGADPPRRAGGGRSTATCSSCGTPTIRWAAARSSRRTGGGTVAMTRARSRRCRRCKAGSPEERLLTLVAQRQRAGAGGADQAARPAGGGSAEAAGAADRSGRDGRAGRRAGRRRRDAVHARGVRRARRQGEPVDLAVLQRASAAPDRCRRRSCGAG